MQRTLPIISKIWINMKMKATTALQTNDGKKATTANDGVKGGSVHGEVDAGVHIDKGACVHGDKAVGLHRCRLAEG